MLSAHLRAEIVESLVHVLESLVYVLAEVIETITHVLTQIVYTLAHNVRDREYTSDIQSDQARRSVPLVSNSSLMDPLKKITCNC